MNEQEPLDLSDDQKATPPALRAEDNESRVPHSSQEGELLDSDSLSDGATQQQSDASVFALSPIDQSSRDLVLAEESLWASLARLKDAGNTLETRLALRDTYAGLARHYASLGGYDAAVRFVKNALEKADDPSLRHLLARLQAHTPGFDFVTSFTALLKDRPYDLKLTLEFCYFLEARNLHQAAINVLEEELKKRLKLSTPADPSDGTIINQFFILLQANVNVELQVHLHEYQQLIEASFPENIVSSLQIADDTPEETIAGQELEEFESEYGLKDELKHFSKLFTFFAKHYAIPTSIVVVSILLVSLTIFRFPSETVKMVGNGFFALLMSFFAFEFLRSLRFPATFRLSAHTKISRNATLTTFVMMMLNWLGPRMLGRGEGFFSTLTIKVMSLVLVAALLWRTHLSMTAIRQSLRKLGVRILNSLERRAFRRQLAGLVAGTSKWALILNFTFGLVLLSGAEITLALFAAVQMLFLGLCWRWGYLEQRAEKQKLRDSLAFIIALAFVALIAIEFDLDLTPWNIVVSLSLDGMLLLAVAITFALQIISIGWLTITISATIFGFLNFAPSLDEFGFTSLIKDIFGQNLPLISFIARILEVLLLSMIVILVRRSRQTSAAQFIHKEIHMESKYKFEGGQFGAVGDGASATDFTQIWNANASQIDLPRLASELAELRIKLMAQAQEPSHFTAIAEVAMAEKAAEEGKGEVALEKLKKAGSWAWDVATKVGIGVATVAAKQALGL